MSEYSKHEVFTTLLSGGNVTVMVDPKRSGCILPADIKDQAEIALLYGYNLYIPIPDLEANGFGISATLSFNRKPSRTFVPWEAIFAVYTDDGPGPSGHGSTGRGHLWAEDMPAGSTLRVAGKRPELRLVD